jgi:hypothetical protein
MAAQGGAADDVAGQKFFASFFQKRSASTSPYPFPSTFPSFTTRILIFREKSSS